VKNFQNVDTWLSLTALSSTKDSDFVCFFILAANSSKMEPFFVEKLLNWIVTLDGLEKLNF